MSSHPAQGAARTEVVCSIKLMASPLGTGLAPATSPAVEHRQLQAAAAHAEAALPAAPDAVLQHLKQGDCATALVDTLVVVTTAFSTITVQTNTMWCLLS